MGPGARPAGATQAFPMASPRPGGGPTGGRPTSELLGSSGMYQTPEGVCSLLIFDLVVVFRSGLEWAARLEAVGSGFADLV